MATVITVPTRDDYESAYLRAIRLRNPNAKTGFDEYYSVQARCLADQLVGVSGMANTIAGQISLRDRTGDQLDEVGRPRSEGGLGLPRPAAVGASGYLTINTVAAGSDIVAGATLQTSAGVSYKVADGASGHYYDGDQFSVICVETGPETNLDPGTKLTWDSPPSGCFATAIVWTQPDGSGLTGGREALGDDDYRELLAQAQAEPSAAANDANLQKQIQNSQAHGVAVKQGFTYPCCNGPATTGFTFIMEGSAKYGSRIPTAAQMNLVAAWVENSVTSTDLLWKMPMIADPLTLTFLVKFVSNGWVDPLQWPPYSGSTSISNAGNFYYGVGSAGKTDLSGLTAASSVQTRYSITVSPSGQKFYIAYPVIWGTSTIVSGPFTADMLPANIVTIAGTQYYLLESTNILTYSGLAFDVTFSGISLVTESVHYIISSATSPTVFSVATSDGIYALRSAPQEGQRIGIYDNQTGKFIRKTIKSVSGSGPWVITCETLANASDLSYLPVAGQIVSPWSDSLQSIADLSVQYVNAMGPGEMISETPPDGIRMTRNPKPTPNKFPYAMTSQLEGAISQLSSVQNAVHLDGSGYSTPVGDGTLVRLASLFDLAVYPL